MRVKMAKLDTWNALKMPVPSCDTCKHRYGMDASVDTECFKRWAGGVEELDCYEYEKPVDKS